MQLTIELAAENEMIKHFAAKKGIEHSTSRLVF